MDDTIKRVTEGLNKAIRAENEGHHFYKMAAMSTQDPKGKEVFQYLAEEEMEHFKFLKSQYRALIETGKGDATLKLGTRKEFSGNHPIFSEGIKNRIKSAHYEMTALSIGMQLELSAVNFYQGEADNAPDDVVKAFYKELATWEKGHLTMLQRQADSLRDDYWNEAGFSPF